MKVLAWDRVLPQVLAVAVAVGVGDGKTSHGPRTERVTGVPVLKKPIVAVAACGG